MSSIGVYGFLLDDKEYLFREEWNPHPSSLGVEFCLFLKHINLRGGALELIKSFEFVDDNMLVPDVKVNDFLNIFKSLSDSFLLAGNKKSSATLLQRHDNLLGRIEDGLIKTWGDTIGFLYSGANKFDCLLNFKTIGGSNLKGSIIGINNDCRWAYIANFDNCKLEVYKGLRYALNNNGRYASKSFFEENMYTYGLNFLEEIPFEIIYDLSDVSISENMFAFEKGSNCFKEIKGIYENVRGLNERLGNVEALDAKKTKI